MYSPMAKEHYLFKKNKIKTSTRNSYKRNEPKSIEAAAQYQFHTSTFYLYS